ncbi:protein of unknown function [Pararobbsia alpina]
MNGMGCRHSLFDKVIVPRSEVFEQGAGLLANFRYSFCISINRRNGRPHSGFLLRSALRIRC